MSGHTLLFGGTANPALAGAVAREMGATLGACTVQRFPDGELAVELREPVRRREVFLLQPTSPPVNDHLVELLAFVDVCRRSAAGRIVGVVPYFGYARGDKRSGRREPIMASMVAALLQAAGLDHLVTVDLHTPQIEGFFQIPVDTLSAVPVLAEALAHGTGPDGVVVSPDAGRVRLATEYAHRLGVPVVVLHKQRESGTRTQVTHVVGEVRGRRCTVVDDMVSTGGTIVEAVRALREAGAHPQVRVAATHGLFLNDALPRLAAAGVCEVLVTDTVAVPAPHPLLRVVSVAPLLARALRRYADPWDAAAPQATPG